MTLIIYNLILIKFNKFIFEFFIAQLVMTVNNLNIINKLVIYCIRLVMTERRGFAKLLIGYAPTKI